MKACKLGGGCKYVAKAAALGSKVALKAKKHQPEIMVIGGVVGGVTATVLACRATRKLDTVIETRNVAVKESKYMYDTTAEEVYDIDTHKRDLALIYLEHGWNLTKLYAPAIGLGALSIGMILGGHRVLQKRNAALIVAYRTLDEAFKDYRKRVSDEVGVQRENDIFHGFKRVTQKVKKLDENGNEIEVDEEKLIQLEDPCSIYATYFDESTSTEWSRTPEYNIIKLRSVQDYMNNLLQLRAIGGQVGHVFLNEVYEHCGLKHTPAGAINGWIYDPDNPDHMGDNKISIGVYELSQEDYDDYVNGIETSLLLDFNVDGPIWDKI